MELARGELTVAAHDLAERLKVINGEIGFVRSVWTGPAAGQFGAAVHEWAAHFAKVVDELTMLAEALDVP